MHGGENLSTTDGEKGAIHAANHCIVDQRYATAAMTDTTPLPFGLPSVQRKKLTADFQGGNQSSDAGLLPREAAAQGGGTARMLAAAGRRRDRHEPGGDTTTSSPRSKARRSTFMRASIASGKPDQAARDTACIVAVRPFNTALMCRISTQITDKPMSAIALKAIATAARVPIRSV
jgi:hypothetical protein